MRVRSTPSRKYVYLKEMISLSDFQPRSIAKPWIVKRLSWKRLSRGLFSHRRLVVSCFKMASVVSIIVEICDEKMANMWRKTDRTYGLLFIVLFSLYYPWLN